VAKAGTRRSPEDLPSDNTARIVLFDAMADAIASSRNFDGMSHADLFERVIPRLRVVVPRELHIQGEFAYVDAKIVACLEADVLRQHLSRPDLLLLGPTVPKVSYPDGIVHDYTAGLEAARERLEADESRLRRGGFDVRRFVQSPADIKESGRYLNLKASIAEHGFLDSSPIVVSASDAVVDGLARLAAAEEAGVVLKKHNRVRLPARRDTPLHHALLVLHLNADRLNEEDVVKVHDAIANRAGRPWLNIQEDLERTREWRRAEPKEYDAKLDVRLVHFSNHDEPKVQMTLDGTRIMLRSVMREAGIPEYRRDDLLAHMPWEEARTQHSGRRAIFVGVDDAIRGIERMQRDRKRRRLKVDTAWDKIQRWLHGLAEEQSGARSLSPSPGDLIVAPGLAVADTQQTDRLG
jgi:hypothetical protein